MKKFIIFLFKTICAIYLYPLYVAGALGDFIKDINPIKYAKWLEN